MSWKRFALTLTLVLALAKVGLFLLYYNTFISLQYDVAEAGAQVDAQLQRRKNVILNLSVMVSDYAEHEKEIFIHAADTRREMVVPKPRAPERGAPRPGPEGGSRAPDAPPSAKATEGSPSDLRQRGGAGDLDALLSKVFAVAERYPDLRLSENFQRYMDALIDAETKIAERRMIYNKCANDMSTAVGRFPGFIFAKVYGFEAPLFFEPEAEARRPPKVEYRNARQEQLATGGAERTGGEGRSRR